MAVFLLRAKHGLCDTPPPSSRRAWTRLKWLRAVRRAQAWAGARTRARMAGSVPDEAT